MNQVSVFYQAEGLAAVEVIEVNADTTVGALTELLIRKHGWTPDIVLFAEDVDDELDAVVIVTDIAGDAGAKVHAHRCRNVGVQVAFNGKTLAYDYKPSATIARIKHRAAHDFGLSKEAAAEHVLQIKGATDQPKPGTHVGALVRHPQCSIAFDLIPKMRVQGACSSAVA